MRGYAVGGPPDVDPFSVTSAFYNHPYGNEKSEIEQNRGQREIEREARHRKQRGEAENEKA